MIKRIGQFLKWTILTIFSLLLLGFLYVWFIVLAKPNEITKASDSKDSEWHRVALQGKTACSDGLPY